MGHLEDKKELAFVSLSLSLLIPPSSAFVRKSGRMILSFPRDDTHEKREKEREKVRK